MSGTTIHPTSARILVDIRGYWLSGSGEAARGDADKGCRREPGTGLPYLPGRQVKGHLRESAERLAKVGAGGWSPELVDGLFGRRPDPEKRISPTRAALHFSNARLPRAFRDWPRDDAPHTDSSAPEEHPLARALFARLPNVAIDAMTGAAKDKHLRVTEVVVPVKLFATVTADPEIAETSLDWIALLDTAAAATLAVGGLKSDGLGRAIIRVESDEVARIGRAS